MTDRLLDCDPTWHWEPLAIDDNGAPAFDKNGGMWIDLTVCGVSRRGYGDGGGKSGGNAVKEAIGDALRNAAMRFGAALDLWHKGELHVSEDAEEVVTEVSAAEIDAAILSLSNADTVEDLRNIFTDVFNKGFELLIRRHKD